MKSCHFAAIWCKIKVTTALDLKSVVSTGEVVFV
jgi:hypothetical protein